MVEPVSVNSKVLKSKCPTSVNPVSISPKKMFRLAESKFNRPTSSPQNVTLSDVQFIVSCVPVRYTLR